MNSDPYLIAVGIIGDRKLTDELLGEVLRIVSGIIPDISEETKVRVRKQLESTIGISVTVGEGLHGGDQEPWLEERKGKLQWSYWTAYKSQLQSSGLSLEVVRVLDEDTDNILNECGDPEREGAWRVQGLVMGDVQSGKTANYCGLVSKCADVGYKVIVLLTGMIEELRAQTQERMDEGFVGRDSRELLEGERDRRKIGVGRFRMATPNVLTSIDSDFLTSNKRSLGGIPLENIREPVLLVMKKNKSPLQNLISFLDSQKRADVPSLDLPLIVIDDEADNASVNAKKDEDPATINRLIREILKRFKRSTYVGYTATPFANVFINPDLDDLFPSNFVYALNPPTNYIGASSMFSEGGRHAYQIEDITDAEDYFPSKHGKGLEINGLPPSLVEAINAFLITCVIRDMRKEALRHRSMLINVSRYTDVQGRLSTAVKQHLYLLTEEVKQYLLDNEVWMRFKNLCSLYNTWEKHYSEAGFTWDDLRNRFYEAIASIRVVTINQRTEESERLNYGLYRNSEKGRRVIAIGGLTLSRGLTLEGLCVSYFYRRSKAYDTLLQMGRWFGYRTDYQDLCKVWMQSEAQDWFEHIASVVIELKSDIRRMHANKQPPSRFGMRVRSHPDALIVTAASKMRNAQEVELVFSYSGFGAETPFLPRSKQVNQSNVHKLGSFLGEIGPAKAVGARLIWGSVDAVKVAQFLRSLEISTMNMDFIADEEGKRPILDFIENNKVAILERWDVCLPQGEGQEVLDLQVLVEEQGKIQPRPRRRQFEWVSEASDYLKLNKQRVGEVSDELVGMKKERIAEAQEEWRRERIADPEKGESVPGYFYRRFRERPLLTISLIEAGEPAKTSNGKRRMMRKEEVKASVLLAISISFPAFDVAEEEARKYRINKVSMRNLGLLSDDDDEDVD